jgi:hypothetical protein
LDRTIPVWLLVVMAVIICIFAIIFIVAKIKKDVEELNQLLKKAGPVR